MDRATVRWGRGLGVLGASALLLTATGCGSAMPPGPAGTTWITSWGGDNQAGMDAALTGTVGEVDRCLVILDGAGTAYYPVLEQGDGRPRGWSEGDTVTMGGGEEQLPAGGPYPDSWTVPEECRVAEDLWIVAPE